MGASVSTDPTLYTAKSIANDQGDTLHVDGVDLNVNQIQDQMIVRAQPRTQSVNVSSDGTVTFTPTWPYYTPTNVRLMAQDSSAATILKDGYYATNQTTSNISIQARATHTAAGSAKATVYYL